MKIRIGEETSGCAIQCKYNLNTIYVLQLIDYILMTSGYIYCFSNASMPGIIKVGVTERTPELRLMEANSSDTWRPPTPYIIEFAKKLLIVNKKKKHFIFYYLNIQSELIQSANFFVFH